MDVFTWTDGPHFKPARGSSVLKKEKDDRDRKAEETMIRKEVRDRDGHCQWPEEHKCRFGLECAHVINASQGGPFTADNLVLICAWIHRRGPESIHGKQLKIEVDTPKGANGPRSFWRQTGDFDPLGQPIYHCVGRETSRGVIERD